MAFSTTAPAFDDNGVFRTYQVWQSGEHRQRFVKERLEPLLAEGPR
jgi:hypothetical protein